jgi:hypothetical protein
MTLEETLLAIWDQAMVKGVKAVELEGKRFPVKKTSQHRLRQVDFFYKGEDLRGLEQNPETKSRWAKMAREGKKVMQFLKGSTYIAVVIDGKVKVYGKLSK